jgi:hypothetical protein
MDTREGARALQSECLVADSFEDLDAFEMLRCARRAVARQRDVAADVVSQVDDCLRTELRVVAQESWERFLEEVDALAASLPGLDPSADHHAASAAVREMLCAGLAKLWDQELASRSAAPCPAAAEARQRGAVADLLLSARAQLVCCAEERLTYEKELAANAVGAIDLLLLDARDHEARASATRVVVEFGLSRLSRRCEAAHVPVASLAEFVRVGGVPLCGLVVDAGTREWVQFHGSSFRALAMEWHNALKQRPSPGKTLLRGLVAACEAARATAGSGRVEHVEECNEWSRVRVEWGDRARESLATNQRVRALVPLPNLPHSGRVDDARLLLERGSAVDGGDAEMRAARVLAVACSALMRGKGPLSALRPEVARAKLERATQVCRFLCDAARRGALAPRVEEAGETGGVLTVDWTWPRSRNTKAVCERAADEVRRAALAPDGPFGASRVEKSMCRDHACLAFAARVARQETQNEFVAQCSHVTSLLEAATCWKGLPLAASWLAERPAPSRRVLSSLAQHAMRRFVKFVGTKEGANARYDKGALFVDRAARKLLDDALAQMRDPDPRSAASGRASAFASAWHGSRTAVFRANRFRKLAAPARTVFNK